ncbi:MAG: hypothetical protein QOG94_3408 [Solirubrobacteraceae bacterium]|jgi:Ca2+-binding RTX toxin-like protein|nr:hypothetical protein [Solirubrobacteraceae bacterium]
MSANRLHSTALGCLIAGTVALAGAAPALATDVTVAGTQLQIIDRSSEANGLEVRPLALGYDVFDDLTDLTAGAGCVPATPHHVSCSGSIAGVAVAAGGGDDVVGLPIVAVPVTVSGGEGSDLIVGGAGDDHLDGGAGEDTIVGGAGNDTITGAGGDDALQGNGGADEIAGGADADIVQGQAGSGDKLAGDGGRDLVEGGAGDDALSGGTGSDVLVTGSGTDSADTGAGRDQVFGTASDAVGCSSTDEVRTGPGAPPDGCGRLPRGETRPDIWPPPPDDVQVPSAARTGTAPIDASAMNAQAATISLPLPQGVFAGRIMHHGDARKIMLRVASDYDMPVRVRIRTFARDGHSLRTFRVNVRAKRWVSVDTGGAYADVWSARARCCVR